MDRNEYVDGKPLQLGTEAQLLLDDAVVEDRFGLTRELYPPEKYKSNPILVRDQPWEGDTTLGPRVIWDDQMQRYRMWYTCFSASGYYGSGLSYYAGYAESDNGFQWTKPLMDQFPIGDHKKTNIVYTGAHTDSRGKRSVAMGQVFKDDHEPDAAKRYKMIALDGRPNPKYNNEVNTEPNLIVSPDGLHWTLDGTSSIFDHHSDTSNQVIYDPARKRWLMYCRPSVYSSGRDMQSGHRHHRRRVSVMTSKDFVNWSYPRTVLSSDEHDLPDIDHTVVFRYGSHFLMLYAAMEGDDTGRMRTRLASSSDGVHWERFHTREDFIPLGATGAWDAGCIGPANPPVRQGEHLLLYYSGANIGQHQGYEMKTSQSWAGGVAMMKADRFVAQRAGEQTGYLLTREFICEGNTLRVNMANNTRPHHNPRLRVEVLQHPPLGQHADYFFKEHGYTYRYEGFGLDDCHPVAADHTHLPITWKGRDLSELRGKPIYLRFEMQDVDLFSFRIAD